jgi:ferredoxin
VQPFINKRRCPAQDQICKAIPACPHGAISYVADETERLGGKIVFDYEKCDGCGIYQYDDDAAAELAKKLGPNYEVKQYQVFADPTAAGAFRFAVFKKGADVPLTYEEGEELCRYHYRVDRARR